MLSICTDDTQTNHALLRLQGICWSGMPAQPMFLQSVLMYIDNDASII